MWHYENCLTIFIFINLNLKLPEGFISTQLNGNLAQKNRFQFSLITENLNGIIFYGFDSTDQFLIKLINGENLIIKYQEFLVKRFVKEICTVDPYHSKYPKYFYWEFLVLLEQMKVIIKCNRRESVVILSGPRQYGILSAYPNPKVVKISKMKSFVWMGNIYVNSTEESLCFSPLKDALIGCMDKFFYNNKQIQFQIYSNKFLPECKNQYREIECNHATCTNKSISYAIDDCSFSALNRRFCWPDDASLPYYSKPKHFYVVNNKPNLILKLKWHNLITDIFCLMQFKTRNKSLIVFSLNQNHKIVLDIRTSGGLIKKVLPLKAIKESLNVLLVEFTNQGLIVKIFINDSIMRYIEPFHEDPESIVTGTCDVDNICSQFIGKMELIYNHSQISTSNHKVTIIIVSCVASISIVLIAIILCIYEFRDERSKIYDLISDINSKYIAPHPQPETSVPNEEDNNYFTYKSDCC